MGRNVFVKLAMKISNCLVLVAMVLLVLRAWITGKAPWNDPTVQ